MVLCRYFVHFTNSAYPQSICSYLDNWLILHQGQVATFLSPECSKLRQNQLTSSCKLNLSQLGLGGQTVKNLHWFACKFDLNQSECRSCKSCPNKVASRPNFSTYIYLQVHLATTFCHKNPPTYCVVFLAIHPGVKMGSNELQHWKVKCMQEQRLCAVYCAQQVRHVWQTIANGQIT